jgi:signal peptidase II
MKKKHFFSLVALLFVVEQAIKLVINANHLQSNQVIIKDFLYFKPMFNRDYSWINSLFNLGVSKALHIVLVSFIVIMVFLVYQYLSHLNLNTKVVSTAFAFLLAGGLCSLVDKVFWDGSLDYIYLKNQFTFDLKDVFINVFIGLMILMYIFDHQGFRTKESDHVVKDFLSFLRRK